MLSGADFIRHKRLHNRSLKDKANKSMNRYHKFIALNLETGKKTPAITLSRGRIAIGDDVWRMSNRADLCEYPYKIVDRFEFNMLYKETETPKYPLPYKELDSEKIV